MTQKELFEKVKVLYVASEVLFFLIVFKTNEYEKAVIECETQCKEQLLVELSNALIKKNDNYYKIIDYLKKCSNGASGYLGMKSIRHLNADLCASNLLYDIDALNRPIYINRPSTLPEDF